MYQIWDGFFTLAKLNEGRRKPGGSSEPKDISRLGDPAWDGLSPADCSRIIRRSNNNLSIHAFPPEFYGIPLVKYEWLWYHNVVLFPKP